MPGFTVLHPSSDVTLVLSILYGRTVADGVGVEVEVGDRSERLLVSPAASRILFLLAEAAHLDESNLGVRERYRGYRATAVLAEAYSSLMNNRFPLHETVVRDHIKGIRRKVNQILSDFARDGVNCPNKIEVIENKRTLGYRIANVRIVVSDAASGKAPPPPTPAPP